ncbi:MAG: magnesium transporter CorA family protein [Eubacteriales bacterium]
MVTFYNSVDGKLQSIDQPTPGSWIYVTGPTNTEIDLVTKIAGIDSEYIRAALDEEESGRIEMEEGITFLIVDSPMALKDEKNVISYTTLPISFIITHDYIVSVCLKDNTVLKDFTDGFIKGVNTAFKTRFLLQILLHSAARYLQYLKQVDKISGYIEKRLYKSTKNKELIQLLDLQKSLVYLSTSLKSIEGTLQKIERGRLLKLYDDDGELLEDVIVEYKQAREMADIYSSILTGTMDAFASVISNNVNDIMKVLTSLTIIMAVPTIISGLYGMNIKTGIPGDFSFWIPVGISGVIMLIIMLILFRKKMF